MNIPEHRDELQALAVRYLYGDMTDLERQAFELSMKESEALRSVMAEEEQFHRFVPVGTAPVIDEQRLQGNRWVLQRRLQRLSSENVLSKWLRETIQQPLRAGMQLTAMAATFALGVFVATDSVTDPMGQPALSSVASTQGPLDLIGAEDYEIYQLEINSFDEASGEIDLSFSVASETRLTGNVRDSEINGLMAVALQNDIDSSARLDTVGILRSVMTGPQVYQAMIQVLRNDPNPGVRYEAVQSLVALADEAEVRQALRHALSEDVNPGVRLAAFDALSEYSEEEETQALFRQRVDNDGNEYIRNQARSLTEGTANAALLDGSISL